MRRFSIAARVAPLLACWWIPTGTVIAAEKNVEAWVAGELAEYVGSELRAVPRYRDRPVRFVVLGDDGPAITTSELALDLRDRLEREVAARGGVRVAWRSDTAGRRLPRSGEDCEAGKAEFLVGIEVLRSDYDRVRVTLRAMDVVERQWITGFSRDWQGRLTSGQRRAAGRTAVDRSFVGDRSLPYEEDETDLIAGHLASALRCELMRQLSGEYVVANGTDDADGEPDPVLALVRNQLTGLSTLRLVTGKDARGNASLDSQLYPVDRSLQQYWVTLTPVDAASGLEPVSTSVYVSLPAGESIAAAADTRDPLLSAPATGIIDRLRLVTLDRPGACPPARPSAFGARSAQAADYCSALSIEASRDALVFVVNHQLRQGLVRIDAMRCTARPVPRLARRGARTLVALPAVAISGNWQTEAGWSPNASSDTWYVIAAGDDKAARSLAALVDRLPQRCGESMRPGIDNDDLGRWLADFEAELARWPGLIDWQAVSIKDVY